MPSNLFYFAIAFALAGLLGFAIQRGGTCTVAAIDEIVIHRRGSRFLRFSKQLYGLPAAFSSFGP